MYRAPVVNSAQENDAVVAQLRALSSRVHAGLGAEMQRSFPEGAAFTHALYGLAWCGAAARSAESDVRAEAKREASWAFVQLDATEEHHRFDMTLKPAYGAFYAGWRNFLLARIVELNGADADAELLMRFDSASAAIAEAYAASASPFSPSYAGQAWPADNSVAMASLALHQQLRNADHRALIARWVKDLRQRTDALGLVAHAWDPDRDALHEAARGSSQSLINCFLPLIDTSIAREQFTLFKQHFLDTRLGVPMVREYPKGTFGMGDVDSGPVVFGVGFAATIVGPGACRANDDPCDARSIDGTVDAFGVPLDQRYIFGALPIADLFIAWTRTMGAPDHACTGTHVPWVFHLWSVVVLMLLWSPTLIGTWQRWRGGTPVR